jgi:hypothetical protein
LSDNTQLPAASGGDTLRTLQRASTPIPQNNPTTGIKTEVVGLDIAGEASGAETESLVSNNNPMPVSDPHTRTLATFAAIAAATQAASYGGAGFYPAELPTFLAGV